jgi:hypothetical protein
MLPCLGVRRTPANRLITEEDGHSRGNDGTRSMAVPSRAPRGGARIETC